MIIDVEGDGSAAAAMAMYQRYKARADAAKREFDALKETLRAWGFSVAGINAEELASADTEPVVITGYHTTLKLAPVYKWRLDTPRIKAERPDIYAAYGTSSVVWELREEK